MKTTCDCGTEMRAVAVISNAKSLQTSLYRCPECSHERVTTVNVKFVPDDSQSLDRERFFETSSEPRTAPQKLNSTRSATASVTDYSVKKCGKCGLRRASSIRTKSGFQIYLCLICAVHHDRGSPGY